MKPLVKLIVPICIVSGILVGPLTQAQTNKTLDSPRKQIIHFDLPSQPLRQGLIEFAIQSDLTVILDIDKLSGLRSRPVIGAFPPEKALASLLSRTPYTFLIEGNTIVIREAEAVDPEPDTVTDELKKESITEILITGQRHPGRYGTISQTRMYGDQASFDVARFINSIPEALFSDQQSYDVTSALRNSSSITPGDGLVDTNDDFFIRGFPRYGLYVDGLRLSEDVGTKQNLANIERIEILKGPSTLLYGQSEPGGIVNVVRKSPRAKTHLITQLGTDSESGQMAMVDANFSSKSNKLRSRFVYSSDIATQFRDIDRRKTELFAPTISLHSDSSSLQIGYEKQRTDQTRDQGTLLLAPINGEEDLISVDRSPLASNPKYDATFELWHARYQKSFAKTFNFTAAYFFNKEERLGIRGTRNDLLASSLLLNPDDLEPDTVPIIIAGGIVIPVDTGTDISSSADPNTFKATLRSLFGQYEEEEIQHARLQIDGAFSALGFQNDVMFGVDWHAQESFGRVTLQERSDIISLNIDGNQQTSTLDVINATFTEEAETPIFFIREQELIFDEYGAFFLNSTDLSERLRLSLGGRYTVTEASAKQVEQPSFTPLETYRDFSSEAGLRYEITDNLFAFLNRSEAVKSNYQIDDFATQFDEPETSEQYEFGLKSFLFSDRLVSTLSAYNIYKQNIVDVQFENGFRRAVLRAEQESLGIDLDAVFEATNNLSLIGSYGYLEPTILSGTNAGNEPRLTSNHTASLFVNNSRPIGYGEASINIGGFYYGDRFANDENTVVLDEALIFDIGAGYTFNLGQHKIQSTLIIKNALDEEFILSTEGRIRTNIGAARRAIFSLKVHF